MASIYNSVEDLVGRTPLLRLNRLEQEHGLQARLLAKLEYRNPAGSVKDRVALSMIRAAEADGRLKPHSVIIEPTSGNTGIGLAAIAAARGYRLMLVMPDTMSVERQLLAAAYGAEVVLTPGAEGMTGAIRKAEALAAELPDSLVAGQFVNPANPAAHYATTGPEIYEDTDGEVDAFVAGIGTGGTITGVAKYLKEHKPAVHIAGIEPADSAVLSGGTAGPHGLQGIGAGFVPATLDTAVLDEIITVTTEEAYAAARELGRREGILVGISSGAALHAAIAIAKRDEFRGKTVVVLLPDTGERYMSTALFAKEDT